MASGCSGAVPDNEELEAMEDEAMEDDDVADDDVKDDDVKDDDVEDDDVEDDDVEDDDVEDEATHFLVTVTNTSTARAFLSSGAAIVPVGASDPGPLFPGNSFEAIITAAPGDHLSFAAMMVQSNDLYFSMGEHGVPLYDADGAPYESLDITDLIRIFDAGTEENQELGTGSNQGPRQAAPDQGPADSNPWVRPAIISEFPNLPAVDEMISAAIDFVDDGQFLLTVINVSNGTTLSHSAGTSAVPIGEVAWAVHRSVDNPFYAVGTIGGIAGIEPLVEAGSPEAIALTLAADTGVTSPMSPGAYAVHLDTGIIFFDGNADRGEGLQTLAESGNPMPLYESLAVAADATQAGVFNTTVGSSDPGPAFPGESYEFEIEARPGARLSLATMYIQSNDLFVSFGDAGLALFGGDTPIDGNVSAQLQLLDAGTEVNQRPGTGSFQAPRQAEPDEGVNEFGVVRMVDDGFEYPRAWEFINVWVTPLSP
jgi:hypothetical protein